MTVGDADIADFLDVEGDGEFSDAALDAIAALLIDAASDDEETETKKKPGGCGICKGIRGRRA